MNRILQSFFHTPYPASRSFLAVESVWHFLRTFTLFKSKDLADCPAVEECHRTQRHSGHRLYSADPVYFFHPTRRRAAIPDSRWNKDCHVHPPAHLHVFAMGDDHQFSQICVLSFFYSLLILTCRVPSDNGTICSGR